MGGGIIQLRSAGKQTKHIIGNPQTTHFKSVYFRHTNFVIESIPCVFNNAISNTSESNVSVKIHKTGDLISSAHIEFIYNTTSFFHTHHLADFIIVDSDPIKHGKTWRGIPIYDLSILKELDWSSTNLLISSYGGQESIAEAADSCNVPEKNIIRLYNTIRRY